jgi:hypothetical protein
VLGAVPLPIHAGSPYALTSILVIALMLTLAAYAMRISVGTRGLFSGAALDA